MEPTTAPVIHLTIGGEDRPLKYGFRAFKELSLNPFKPQTIVDFMNALDIDKAAEFIRAGLLHEYSKSGARVGQQPPSAEDIIDSIDLTDFASILSQITEALGLKPATDDVPSEPADPQTA